MKDQSLTPETPVTGTSSSMTGIESHTVAGSSDFLFRLIVGVAFVILVAFRSASAADAPSSGPYTTGPDQRLLHAPDTDNRGRLGPPTFPAAPPTGPPKSELRLADASRPSISGLLAPNTPEFLAAVEPISLSKPVVVSDTIGIGNGELASFICSDPRNPRRLIAGVSEGELMSSTSAGNMERDHLRVLLSSDGGDHWSTVMRTNDDAWYMDPACAFAEDGSIILSMMLSRENARGTFRSTGYHLLRSVDDGKSWAAHNIDYDRLVDRGYLTVDRSDSPHKGRLYLSGMGLSIWGDSVQRPTEMLLFHSDDNGRSFHPPTTVDGGLGSGIGFGTSSTDVSNRSAGVIHAGTPTVLPDGSVVVSWYNMYAFLGSREESARNRAQNGGRPASGNEESGTSKMMIAVSHDGGVTFDAPVVVGKGRWTWDIEHDGIDGVPGKFVPGTAADMSGGPFRGALYAAWADLKNGSKEVWFSASTDGGKSWQPPKVISEKPRGNADDAHSFQVSIAVNSHGAIGVYYYKQHAGTRDLTPVFVASTDGGTTWTSERAIAPSSISRSRQRLETMTIRPAKTADEQLHLAYQKPLLTPSCSALVDVDSDGTFHLLGLQNPMQKLEVYQVAAKIQGEVTKVRELQREVTVLADPIKYSKSTGEYSLSVRVRNDSGDALPLPLTLVAAPLPEVYAANAKFYGAVEVMATNADNRRGNEAKWEFRSAAGAELASGETVARVLKFKALEGSTKDKTAEAGFRVAFRIYVRSAQ